MRCEVADDPVVVMKSRPVKPGNGVEGKTKTTRWSLPGGRARQKRHGLRRGEVHSKSVRSDENRQSLESTSRMTMRDLEELVPSGNWL